MAGSARSIGPLTREKVESLQSSAGNQAVQRIIAANSAPAGGASAIGHVQRKLDANRFSKAGFRGAGLKPGFRLIGQSKFADIETALALYHAAKSRSEELAALDRIEIACDAWLQSGFRTEKHSAAKATEEAAKQAEVTALVGEVQKERDEILSTMDPTTLGSLDAERGVVASIATLARALGLTQDVLKQTAPATLREMYVAQVLQPFYIARKTPGADTGMVGQLVDLMFQMGNVTTKDLPDGDTKDILQLIQQAGLPDRNALMHEFAPKYAQGGVGTEQVTPAVPGWAATSTVAVTGNLDFRSKVKAMIPVIAGTEVGKKLLAGIGGDEPDLANPAHPAKKQAVVEIKLPKVTHLQYQAPGGDMRYGNAGGAKAITFDPESDVLGKPDQVAAEPWRQREPVVALFHELIHVYLAKIGGEDWVEAGEKLHLSHDDEKAEVRIVGIDYKVKKADKSGDVTFPFSNPARNPITENEFRKQLAASQGQATFLPRPTYATVAGQVPLPAGPTKL